ncbi:retrieval of early ER protein Rer1 [Kockiozyma suomiensis]|uniref:retrieval of early ER protein Rer1 n=1 Tax=Kockiozyma suomiensis TaxID=1337062 RepID=UPI003343EAE3
MDAESSSTNQTPLANVAAQTTILSQRFQFYLDQSTPYVFYRWVGSVTLLFFFMLRIVLSQGWYIVCYSLGIYLLNLFLAFLQPKFDPSLEQDLKERESEEGGALPTRQDEEFRPFIRRLPEFKFWYSATKATAIAFVCTWFPIFDVPVFWPILLIYFCILFAITMRRQIQHMVKYRYLPFDLGKVRYSRNRSN